MISKGNLIKSLLAFLLFPTLFSAQLKHTSNQADYLIITPSDFCDELTEFISWREEKGFSVDLIELNNIYSEFPDSLKQNSIREFISYALSNWSDPKPEYVLLVGGVELLPSYRVESFFKDYSDIDEDTVSIDEWFAVNLYEDDSKPDIKIGRFPVENKEELRIVIDKTIFWEDKLRIENYKNDFLILTDITDSIAFLNVARNFIDDYLVQDYRFDNIFASKDSIIENSRTKLITNINTGTLFLNYYGHGYPEGWSKFNLFTVNDIDLIVPTSLPFIFNAVACSQNFDIPSDSSLIRNLIVADQKGAVASIASSGLSYLRQGENFLEGFYHSFLREGSTTIGDAFYKSKLENFNGGEDSAIRRYTILGDPALKLPIDLITDIPNEPIITASNYKLKQNYPNPFNPTTRIEYSVIEHGKVTIKVFNLLGKEMATLVEEQKQPGYYHINFDGSNLSSGVYFYQMKVNDFVEIKKCLLLK